MSAFYRANGDRGDGFSLPSPRQLSAKQTDDNPLTAKELTCQSYNCYLLPVNGYRHCEPTCWRGNPDVKHYFYVTNTFFYSCFFRIASLRFASYYPKLFIIGCANRRVSRSGAMTYSNAFASFLTPRLACGFLNTTNKKAFPQKGF